MRLDRFSARFGQRVRVLADGAWRERRAFLQPLREKREAAPSGMSALGWQDGRRWLYLGTEALREGDALEWNGLRLRAVSGRAVGLGAQACYWRAVLVRDREAAV